MKKLLKKYNMLFLLFITIFLLLFYSCNDDLITIGYDPVYSNLDESPAWTPDGQRIIYFHAGIDSMWEGGAYFKNPDSAGLWFIDIDGTNRRRFLKGSYFDSPDISPDGKWILYSTGNQIYKIDTSGNNLTQLTFQGGRYARWSPDGEKIIYVNCSQDTAGVYMITKDGNEKKFIYPALCPSWSYVGSSFAGIRGQATQGSAVSIIDTLGNLVKDLLLYNENTTIRYTHCSFINNIIAIEWQNTNTIVPTIWTINPGSLELRHLITEGSITPRWSPDGTKIAYIKFDGRVYDKNNGTIWIANSDGTKKIQLTPGLK